LNLNGTQNSTNSTLPVDLGANTASSTCQKVYQ
jgi:hypothetical protein